MNNRIVSLLTVLLCTSVVSVCGNKDSEIVSSSHGKKSPKSLLKKERNNKSDEQAKRSCKKNKQESSSDGRYSKENYKAASVHFSNFCSTNDLPWPAKEEIDLKDPK